MTEEQEAARQKIAEKMVLVEKIVGKEAAQKIERGAAIGAACYCLDKMVEFLESMAIDTVMITILSVDDVNRVCDEIKTFRAKVEAVGKEE